MRPKSFMVIAGEASGDTLAAELVHDLRGALADADAIPTRDYQPLRTSLEPRFFGAGGPRMAAAGVDLAFDLTVHSVVGFSDVVRNYLKFRRFFHQLLHLAIERQPDAIICVDFSGFNRRFVEAIKRHVRTRADWFHGWNPKTIQYVSPQVWASREGRAYQMARDYDLLLSIFPFEKEWYAKRVPKFHVEFIGHPMVDRYQSAERGARSAEPAAVSSSIPHSPSSPNILLLPGSRRSELTRHLPVMIRALALMRASLPELRARMVLPNQTLAQQARAFGLPTHLEVQVGTLSESMAGADVAIASTGTVTMECAYFGLPTVAIYKTSWTNYQIGKQIVKVKWLAMPNILANEPLFPEFIQNDATPENIARAALEIARDETRRAAIKARLAGIVAGLGGPGASRRAAQAVACLMRTRESIRI
jgi:lipid-A-disaccharide synthase